MSQVQLFAKQQDSTEYVNLQLHSEEPIKLTLSVSDIVDPLAATSVFSRTFKIPHTDVNGRFMEGVFNVNSMNFDAAKKADAYINDNGAFFSNGNIRLNAIYVNDSNNNVEYEIIYYGETSDFGSKIGGGFLNQLDFSAYNHDKNYTNITNSWTNGLFDGDVVYGLVEWGYTYTANGQPALPTLSNGFAKSFTSNGNPLQLEQWKPQFRAKAIWDTIFNESTYTYDSTFLEGTLFRDLYIISDNVASAVLAKANTFKATQHHQYYNVVGGVFDLQAGNTIADPGNLYDSNTSTYTAPSTGTYTFTFRTDVTVQYNYGIDPVSIFAEMMIYDIVTGQQYGSESSTIYEGYNQLNYSVSVNLIGGTKIRWRFRSLDIANVVNGTELEFYGITLACTQAPNILNIGGIMPANVRKIDFMRSIINRFRLVFIPSKAALDSCNSMPW